MSNDTDDTRDYDQELRDAAASDGGRGWAQKANKFLVDGPAAAKSAVDRWFNGQNHTPPKAR